VLPSITYWFESVANL